MEFLLELVLPLVLCAIFARNHVFAAVIYVCMLLLSYFNMTVMLFMEAEILLIALVLIFLALFVIERQWKRVKGGRAKILLNALAIIRYPVNFIYLGDIIFRLQHWGPIDDIPQNQPLLGSAVGYMLELPLVASLIAAVTLLVLYVAQITKEHRAEVGAKHEDAAG
jgi:hypothetical protein